MKSLILLWKVLAEESAGRCYTSATQDYKKLLRRVEHEGLSFLTITLPAFGKDFEKSLDRGQVDHELFKGFAFGAGLPRFLGGFLDRVFDRGSGDLLAFPCIDAILAVRQLTLMFSKIALECSDARYEHAIQEYVECEWDVKRNDALLSEADMADFRRVSSLLFASLFSRVDFDVYYGKLIPKHGPGATADKLRGNSKFRQHTWTSRLENILPSGEYLIPSWSFLDQYDAVDILEPGSEVPVKVISVPKTMKTPRIIAVEPTCMQYAQQSILRSFQDSLKRHDYLSMIIGLDDQTPNQRMAQQGSLLGDLATLDLSEASDRVSNQLVRAMLQPHPHLHAAVDASRSRKADVPGHGIIRLSKFASMGSALTFPMEAVVFTTLIFLGIERELGSPLGPSSVKQFSDKVRVYGDDLIVPADMVDSVLDVLSAFGLKVNVGKSFWTGKFRESCGREYYDGHDVSIVKVRQMFPADRNCATEVISLVSLRNQLYFAGYWATCQWLDGRIKDVLRHYPVVLPSSRVLGRHSFLGFESQRYDKNLHIPLVKGYVVSAPLPSDPLEGAGALLKFHLAKADSERDLPSATTWLSRVPSAIREMPISDVNHLNRAGRPLVVSIKPRWVSPL